MTRELWISVDAEGGVPFRVATRGVGLVGRGKGTPVKKIEDSRPVREVLTLDAIALSGTPHRMPKAALEVEVEEYLNSNLRECRDRAWPCTGRAQRSARERGVTVGSS